MTWWSYLRTHGQRPACWTDLLRPAYWTAVNQQRQAQIQTSHQPIPCGQCRTTQFVATDGTVLRQDVAITVGREALRVT